MKKPATKLSLVRETVRNLSPSHLSAVIGGVKKAAPIDDQNKDKVGKTSVDPKPGKHPDKI